MLMSFLYLYQHLPLNIDPIAFTVGSFSIRWYAISYVVAFGVVYLVLMWRIKKGELPKEISNLEFRISRPEADQSWAGKQIPNPNTAAVGENFKEIRDIILDFLLVAFFAAIVGGRIGYILFYNSSYFLAHPLAMVWPFENGNFVGFYGMSYHGGLVGVLIGSWIFLRIKKINFWKWTDFIVPAVPLGYFFGRIGNFLNGELYGRVTDSPLGMYFAADKISLRWPSQLAEGFLEGIVLFIILWIIRKKETAMRRMLGIYLIGYGFLRIVGEFFREPDPQIGFFLGFLTLGQIMSSVMIIGGLIFLLKRTKK